MLVTETPIPYGRQEISAADVEAVTAVLRSDWLTQGPAIERFERAVADYCGAKHAVAVCNATAALHLACRSLGLGAGDRLWTTPNTFVASANCGLYCGAEVGFVDIDPRTYNMSVDQLRSKLEAASKTGRLPKIVVPVDFSGQSAELAEIAQLGQRYGFRIIEDASHAIGGDYRGTKIGCSRYADITVFSFHPVKIITTGEGGMALTNDAELSRKLALLQTHGITRDPNSAGFKQGEGGWYYEQADLGYNYRMTDIQAALGLSQLSRVDEFVERRRRLAARYTKALGDMAVKTPWKGSEGASAWHLYVITIDAPRTGQTRRQVFDFLRNAGILVNVHYIPVHLQPYYRRNGFGPGDFPEAEAYYEVALSLPLYFGLSEQMQDYVIETLAEAVR
jgi:UDP-4-amino-4,6-dideoxy-N-acetyl-beta-L-altrosamine transaminase